MYDVIIIGGGAAGLMAAKFLSEHQKSVLLLEAKPGLGGRIHCIDSFSFDAQAGAEFIHGDLKTTLHLLKEAGLKKQKLKGKFCRVKNDKWTMDDEQVPHWNELIKSLYDCEEDTNVDTFLRTHLLHKKYNDSKEQFKKYVEGYDTADTKKANVFAIRKEMKNEDENQYWPVPGYHAMIGYLEKKCRENNVIIKTNEPVKKVNYGTSVEVITTLKRYTCKKIIIAVPLGVLQCNKSHANFIEFPAALKKYISAAKKIGNGNVIKFLLEFDTSFWLDEKFLKQKNISPPSYIFTDAKIPTWWTQYPSRKPLLTGWIGGPPSYKIKNYSENKLKQLAVESLASVFALPYEKINKNLKTFRAINWIKESHILGAYSYATVQTNKARSLLQQPVNDTFYFAGEYVVANSTATVDAALKSGADAAFKAL